MKKDFLFFTRIYFRAGINKMIRFAPDRNLFLDVLAILFGTASWISINGLWVELPLLVNVLPESWSLASYLSIIVQIANIGPITYAILRWQFRVSNNLVYTVKNAHFIRKRNILDTFFHPITLGLFYFFNFQKWSFLGKENFSTPVLKALMTFYLCLISVGPHFQSLLHLCPAIDWHHILGPPSNILARDVLHWWWSSFNSPLCPRLLSLTGRLH